MPGTRCTASIIAVSFCEAHELARQDFEECLLSFPEIHARIKLLAEQRATKLKSASENDQKARVRRPTPVGEEKSEDGTPRDAFKGSILKTLRLATQRLRAPVNQPLGAPAAAGPKARSSPCAQYCKARPASTVNTVAHAGQPCVD